MGIPPPPSPLAVWLGRKVFGKRLACCQDDDDQLLQGPQLCCSGSRWLSGRWTVLSRELGEYLGLPNMSDSGAWTSGVVTPGDQMISAHDGSQPQSP